MSDMSSAVVIASYDERLLKALRLLLSHGVWSMRWSPLYQMVHHERDRTIKIKRVIRGW